MYTVHFFDENDHARGAIRLSAHSDAEAIEQGGLLSNGHAREVWNGDRLIARFDGATGAQRKRPEDALAASS